MRIVIGGKPYQWDHEGLGLADQARPFSGHARSGPINSIVIHESVTSSIATTARVLRDKGCGVHFMIDMDGKIEQWADLAHELYHAKGHNLRSIGVEIINPYYPEHAKAGTMSIPAPWADKGRDGIKNYVVPMADQMAALHDLVTWLTSANHGAVQIPRLFAGLSDGKINVGVLANGNFPVPGIWAHGQQWWVSAKTGRKSNHADGRFPALYLALRMHSGLDHLSAMVEAIHGAQRSAVTELPAPKIS